MNISTILPYTIKNKELYDIFGKNVTYIYYSLYSIEDKFRQKWIPNAINYELGLEKLKNYQLKTNNLITFHWAFIKDENDNETNVRKLIDKIKEYDIKSKFNLVRYNPFDKNSKETSEEKLKYLLKIIKENIDYDNKSYIVPRVGPDVYASCGMFEPK